ncbi:hypothetical protein CPLU01_09549 [Colletotrichum plurivorum]|uniref:Uncharacterized protein n=1 Tax=Colletotrichum plurivorum TaxID=2175906 RepID=A0A8H6K881_9PEZI|nr:hypothetical protein CPLU01_09549 [Colletotrichum plurivorum]
MSPGGSSGTCYGSPPVRNFFRLSSLRKANGSTVLVWSQSTSSWDTKAASVSNWSKNTTEIPGRWMVKIIVDGAGTKDSGLADQPIDAPWTDIPRRRIQGIGAHEASWAATGAPPEKLAAAGGDVGGGPSRKGPEVKRWPRDEALLGAGKVSLAGPLENFILIETVE